MSSEASDKSTVYKETAAQRNERIEETLLDNEMRCEEQEKKLKNLTTVVEEANLTSKTEFEKIHAQFAKIDVNQGKQMRISNSSYLYCNESRCKKRIDWETIQQLRMTHLAPAEEDVIDIINFDSDEKFNKEIEDTFQFHEITQPFIMIN